MYQIMEKHLPDYEFKLWNEENFDVNSTLWTQHAYELKNMLLCPITSD